MNAVLTPLPADAVPWPPLSVIVITRDRHALAQEAVNLVLTADYPSDKRTLIVVEETDTPHPFKGDGIRYRPIPRRGLGFAYARNRGLELAASDIVVFTDDDCRAAPDWLKELVRPLLENPDVVAVGGAVEVPPCGPIGRCEHILGFPGGGLRASHEANGAPMDRPTFSTCNCALRKSAVERAGGFCEALRHGGEDENLSRALASFGRIVFAPRARVRHRPRDTLRSVWQWFVRRGQACVEQGRNSSGQCHWRRRLLWRSPIARLAAVLAVCVVLRWPPAPILGVVAALYYGSVLWRQRWAWHTYPSWHTLLWLPVVKAVMDVAMDAGIVRGILQQFTLWKISGPAGPAVPGKCSKSTAGATTPLRFAHRANAIMRIAGDAGTEGQPMSEPPLRVGYLFNEADVVGGGELSFLDLADAIRAQGIEPLAYVPAEGEITAALRARGLPWRVWPWPPVRWYRGLQCLRHARRTAALFVEDRLALVHANGARCMLYAGPAARRAGIPCVWHVRVLQRDGWLDRFRASHARVILANSRAVAATLRSVAAATPVEVLYNGFDLARLRNAAPVETRDLFQFPPAPVVLGVGRFSRWKGFDDLLRACALLQQQGLVVACVLAGRARPGEEAVEAGLKALAPALGLRHVVFAGWRADTAGLMKTASVLAVPSHGEPFGRVIIEGWACGVPVVATRAGGPAELIRDGEDGLLAEVGRPDRLADAIRRVVTDPTLAGRLRRNGLRRAMDFSLDEHAGQVARVYRDALTPASHCPIAASGAGGAA